MPTEASKRTYNFLILKCIISLYSDFMMYICIIDGLSLFDIKQSKSERKTKKKGNIIYVDFVETEIEL